MSGDRDGPQSHSDRIPRHLSDAQHHLLVAILHLAAIEDEVIDQNLLRSRRLIATSLDWVEGARKRVTG